MLKLHDLVEAKIYDNDEAAIQDALRLLPRARPEVRIRLAIHRYQTEDISLAKAAELAGVSWQQMKDILIERGIRPRLGPQTPEESKQEVEALQGYFYERAR